ncbi:SDR family oxidoreductase [Clostridium tyrobutyricum]|nr:SDR family oxidoreductase [Clostridium tyrobutyricum]
MIENNKKSVLITGASSGIGYELSKIFARNGFNLILIARNKTKLIQLSNYLINTFHVDIKIIIKDLNKDTAAEDIFNEIKEKKIKVHTLINNAGIGYCGIFHNTNIEKDLYIIYTNIRSLTILTKLFSKEMVKNGEGNILNVASTGAFQPGPYISTYYASKAYVLSFSQAIRNELKNYKVNVSVLCPGATLTSFSKNAGKKDIKNSMSPKKVAEIAYKGLKKKKGVIIPGTFNKTAIIFSKLLPGYISAKIVRKIQESVTIN